MFSLTRRTCGSLPLPEHCQNRPPERFTHDDSWGLEQDAPEVRPQSPMRTLGVLRWWLVGRPFLGLSPGPPSLIFGGNGNLVVPHGFSASPSLRPDVHFPSYIYSISAQVLLLVAMIFLAHEALHSSSGTRALALPLGILLRPDGLSANFFPKCHGLVFCHPLRCGVGKLLDQSLQTSSEPNHGTDLWRCILHFASGSSSRNCLWSSLTP